MPSPYASVFRPGLFAGQAASKGNAGAIINIIADMWQGMPTMGHSGAARAGMLNFTETAAAFISGSCLRVDGAVPNAKRKFSNKNPTQAFDGFHLASKPKVLD